MAVSPTICPDFVWHCLNFPLSDFSRTLLCKGNSGRKVINLYLPWKPLIRGDLKERPIERCCIFEGGEREAGRGLSLVHTSSPIGDFSSPGLFLTVPLSDACLHWSYIEDCPTPPSAPLPFPPLLYLVVMHVYIEATLKIAPLHATLKIAPLPPPYQINQNSSLHSDIGQADFQTNLKFSCFFIYHYFFILRNILQEFLVLRKYFLK